MSLSDYVKAPTKDAYVARFIAFLSLAGFPARAWQALSFLRFTVESESELLAEVGKVIAEIAKGMHARLAKGPWLDLIAENLFADARKPSVTAIGELLLSDVAGVGPTTISIGQQWFANGSKTLRYVVHELPYGGAVPLNGQLRIRVRAELAGATYNAGNGVITQLVTSLPGIDVTNPAIGTTGTWLVVQGVDTEKDEQLLRRLLDKWATLGTGATDGAYRYYAASASPEISRVVAWSPGAGSVRVAVAGPSAPVSGAALALASSAVAVKRPLGVPDVVTQNATTTVIPIVGVLHLRRGVDSATAIADAQARVDAEAREHEIGEDVSRERVIADLMVPGCRDLTLTSPAADEVIAQGSIYVPSYTLTATVDP